MSKTAAEIAARRARNQRMTEYHIKGKPDFTTLNLELTDEQYNHSLGNMLNWLNSGISNSDLRDTTINWGKENGYDFPNLIHVPEYKFATVGKLVYILREGGQLTERLMTKIKETIPALAEEGEAIEKKAIVKNSYQKFTPNQGLVVADELQDLVILNQATSESISDLLFEKSLNSIDLNTCLNKVNMLLADWESNDPQCQEMREIAGEERASYFKNTYRLVIKIIGMVSENIKAERASSKKAKTFKEVRIEKKVKNVKTKKIDTDYNIVSLPADEIIGSTVLLTFNTKTRRVGYFVAKDGGTLSVKGSSIIDFDEERSMSKILRNTDRDLAPFRAAKNERRLEVLINDTIKGVRHPVTGRLNSDTTILKAFKDKK